MKIDGPSTDFSVIIFKKGLVSPNDNISYVLNREATTIKASAPKEFRVFNYKRICIILILQAFA